MPELDSGVSALSELVVVDYGDAPTAPMSIERSLPEVRKFVAEVASVEISGGRRTIPIIIGGGHVLMYPDAAGLTDVYGKGNLSITFYATPTRPQWDRYPVPGQLAGSRARPQLLTYGVESQNGPQWRNRKRGWQAGKNSHGGPSSNDLPNAQPGAMQQPLTPVVR